MDSAGRTGAAFPEQRVAPLQPLYPGMDEVRSEPEPAAKPPRSLSDDLNDESDELSDELNGLPAPTAEARSGTPSRRSEASNLTRSQRRRRGRKRARAARGGGAVPGRSPMRPRSAASPLANATPAQSLPAAVPTEPNETEDLPAAAESGAQPHASRAAQGAHQTRGVIVLAIGLPGSGKSSWFKRRGVTALSSDLIRTLLFDDISEQRFQHLVFSTLRSVLRARMIAHMPWNYVDATNLNARERRHWVQMAREFGYEVHAVFFDVPLEVCQDRNQRRQRVVAAEVMQNMAARLQPPKFEEGFTKITVVRVKRP